jgi:hypothetical protein
MEEKPKSVTMNGITYGAIAAVVMIIYSLLLYLFDQHLNRGISWISYVILLGIMIWGTIDYRKKALGGLMSYGKAYSTSFMIALFAIIIATIYTYFFFQFIAPDAVQDIADMSRERIIRDNPDISDEDLERAMGMQSFVMNPLGLTISGFIYQVVISAIVCLITSIFLRKEDKSTI